MRVNAILCRKRHTCLLVGREGIWWRGGVRIHTGFPRGASTELQLGKDGYREGRRRQKRWKEKERESVCVCVCVVVVAAILVPALGNPSEREK